MPIKTTTEGAKKALDWLNSKDSTPREKVLAAFDRLDWHTYNFFDTLEDERLREFYWQTEKLREGPDEERDDIRTIELLKEFAERRLQLG